MNWNHKDNLLPCTCSGALSTDKNTKSALNTHSLFPRQGNIYSVGQDSNNSWCIEGACGPWLCLGPYLKSRESHRRFFVWSGPFACESEWIFCVCTVLSVACPDEKFNRWIYGFSLYSKLWKLACVCLFVFYFPHILSTHNLKEFGSCLDQWIFWIVSGLQKVESNLDFSYFIAGVLSALGFLG